MGEVGDGGCGGVPAGFPGALFFYTPRKLSAFSKDISASLSKKNNFSLLSHGTSAVEKYQYGKQSSGESQ